MEVNFKSKHLLLKSSAILGALIFFTYLIYDLGVLNLIIDSDKSKISLIILAVYCLATFHWYFLSFSLDKEIEGVNSGDVGSSARGIINRQGAVRFMTQHQDNAETLAAKVLKHLLHPMTYYRSYRENGAKAEAQAKGVYLWDTVSKNGKVFQHDL